MNALSLARDKGRGKLGEKEITLISFSPSFQAQTKRIHPVRPGHTHLHHLQRERSKEKKEKRG
jgi:hypothetical protein